MNMPEKPPYAPNVVNQTVEYGGATWKGEPGGDWYLAGGGGIDMSQVPSVQEYVKSQFAAEDPYLKELVMGMRARQDPLELYSQLEEEAGLPELRRTSTTLSKEIAAMEDYLDQIEPDIAARTRESLVTEAQRRGMVETGREPFLQKLTKLGTAAGRISGRISEAERGIATKAELGLRGEEMALEPLKLQYQVMADRNARMLTGFTADRQTQLDVLFDKLQRQRQLDDREWELANTLASEERSYMKQLGLTAAQAGVELKGGESADDILELIGSTALGAITWERGMTEKEFALKQEQARKTGAGTETERAAEKTLTSLRSAIASYSGYEDLVRRYSDKIPVYQIRDEWNKFHGQGAWTENLPGAATESLWTLGPAKEKEYWEEDKDKGTIKITRPDGSVVEF